MLLVDDTLPRACWELASVVETETGAKDRVRAVTIRTSARTFRRTINKLVLLLTDEEQRQWDFFSA